MVLKIIITIIANVITFKQLSNENIFRI